MELARFYCLLTLFSALSSTLIAKLLLSVMEEHFKAFCFSTLNTLNEIDKFKSESNHHK